MTTKKLVKDSSEKATKAIRNKAIGQMIGLGVIAGMRATFAPAFISNYFSKHANAAISSSGLKFLGSPITSTVTKALVAMEIAGDKSPSAPDRTSSPQIYIRVASGALAGAAVAKANGQGLVKGILIGGIAALAGSFGAFYLRKYIDTLPHIKDVYTGAAEDAIALGAGALLMK